MMMHPESPKTPIALEDLLRLKRTERPPAEFWLQFDRELRAKQLAALVEKRPWWRRLPRVLAGGMRYHLPLGATALLALTFVATRDYRATAPHSTEAAAALAAAPVSTAATPSVVAAVSSDPMATLSPAINESAAPAELERTLVAAQHEPTFVPVSMADETPSARHIAANLAAVQTTEFVATTSLLAPTSGLETQAQPARTHVAEPLAQMTPPAERSRARFVTAMAASYANELPQRSSERMARRLSDTQLQPEMIRRIGGTGNSVAWKF